MAALEATISGRIRLDVGEDSQHASATLPTIHVAWHSLVMGTGVLELSMPSPTPRVAGTHIEGAFADRQGIVAGRCRAALQTVATERSGTSRQEKRLARSIIW